MLEWAVRAGVAQLVEHLTCNEAVIGSIPIAGFFTVHTSIAVVVHNSAGALRACLEGLRREPPSKAFEVLVVDAGSSEDLAAVRSGHPDVQWISMENRGYAAAVNTALARARGTLFVFANADARLTGPVVDALVDELRARQIGLVAPHVRSGGQTRSPLRPAPSLGRDAVAAVVPVRWRDGVRRALRIGEPPPSLDGPCHAMRAADLRALGGLDESFFLYFEETHLAQRVRAAGQELAAVDAVLDHEGGASAAISLRTDRTPPTLRASDSAVTFSVPFLAKPDSITVPLRVSTRMLEASTSLLSTKRAFTAVVMAVSSM